MSELFNLLWGDSQRKGNQCVEEAPHSHVLKISLGSQRKRQPLPLKCLDYTRLYLRGCARKSGHAQTRRVHGFIVT